jgi:hypothetical protein
MSIRFSRLIEEVEFLAAERRLVATTGPSFKIWHRYHMPGTPCMPGEECAAIFLFQDGREFCLPLSLTARLVFDFLAKHPRLPQSAAQITAAMKADPFYHLHGANAAAHVRLTRKISRSSIKVYVERLRIALQQTFRDAEIQIDPFSVLVSKETSSNEVGYQLRARIEWIHIDHPGRRSAPKTGS